MKKVLFAGETWFKYTIHVKGFDSFKEGTYGSGADWLINALEEGGYDVTHIPNHLVGTNFPSTKEELEEYDLVILSDIGSNTLLLSEKTFVHSIIEPNRIDMIRDYVLDGGSFIMIGGYMSFTGIDGNSRYGKTSLKEILPVKCLEVDDRCEHPEGIVPEIKVEHPIFEEVDSHWPHFLGYNKTIIRDDAQLLATIGEDPFIAVGNYGKGKSAVFTSDCAPHWGPHEFVEWKSYNKFWQNLADFLTE